MERKPYPEAKRRILIELRTADFIEFLEEVTYQEGKLFIQNQLVPGFRDGRAPFTRTVPQLITKLKSEHELTNPDSAIWNLFANVWTYWIKSHQELDNALTAFDNGRDFDENHNCIKLPNSELDIECFKFLLEASRNSAIHQEIVNRFYKYGYFNEDERIQNLINQMPSCEEIERRKQLAGLPNKVDELSRTIEDLNTQVSAAESTISEIKSKMTDEPRITRQVLKLAEWYKTELQAKTERYTDENEYLGNFHSYLRRFGITDPEDEEMAAAIHIALKAFPAVEIADSRIIKVWKLMCDNHLYNPIINVEMGWLGLQDWFPDLFAEECFGIRLERVELKASIEKMLEVGDMPWVICFWDCDRSFPETYLPRFLDWINKVCKGGIKVFLIRSVGTNRCETNEDFYERVAHLPKPKSPEPIESRNLRPSGFTLTLSEWESWCRPDPDIDSQYERHYDFLDELRSTVENRDRQIPIEILREIQRYLRLSHNILAKTRSLDWALTLRLLPWIGNRHRLIDIVQNLVSESNQELPHFHEGLQMAREAEA